MTEQRSKPKTSGIEMLGSYHPKTKAVVLKNERISYWISKGAKVSDTVHNLLISKGVIKGKKIDVAKARPTQAPAAAGAAVSAAQPREAAPAQTS